MFLSKDGLSLIIERLYLGSSKKFLFSQIRIVESP